MTVIRPKLNKLTIFAKSKIPETNFRRFLDFFGLSSLVTLCPKIKIYMVCYFVFCCSASIHEARISELMRNVESVSANSLFDYYIFRAEQITYGIRNLFKLEDWTHHFWNHHLKEYLSVIQQSRIVHFVVQSFYLFS